jgi:hypothetical protein
LIVEWAEVVPAVAKPGDEVRVKVRYSVLAPNPQATIPVTETWLFLERRLEAFGPLAGCVEDTKNLNDFLFDPVGYDVT